MNTAGNQRSKPLADRRIGLTEYGHRRSGAVHKQSSEVVIDAFRYSEKPWLASCRELSWNEPWPRAEISRMFEAAGVADSGNQGRGC
ncbi:hypothetical protein AGR8A_pTi20170 [Agrobacterium fabrum str. J-07]|nr:hypothetical protein AGR8A_pTi20170 [Agrobacterium fabrum str. J-07]